MLLVIRRARFFSIKFILCCALLLFVVFSAEKSMAAGAQFAPSLQTISTVSGAYIEAGLGGVRSQYPDLFSGFNDKDWNNSNWQLATGVDAGYRFDSYLAAELGYQYFLSATGKTKKGADKVTFSPMAFYGAAKFIVPIYTGLDAFFKVGLSYSKLNIDGNLPVDANKVTANKSVGHWGPVFAVGSQYYFNDSLSVSATYSRYPGLAQTTLNPQQLIPAFNVILIGFGFHFNI